MLASAREYLHIWQLPIFLVFAAGWIFGGGWLLHRAFRKCGYEKRLSVRKCFVCSLLAGGAGGASAMIVFFLFRAIGTAAHVKLTAVGVILAAAVMAVIAVLVLYAMFEMPMRRMVATAAVPVAAVMVLAAALAAAAGLPAYRIRKRQIQRGRQISLSLRNLARINQAIRLYQSAFRTPPDSLTRLVEKGYIDADVLRPPGSDDQSTRYFYLPAPPMPAGQETRKIQACTSVLTGGGVPRVVLLANGNCSVYDEQNFQLLLDLPENAAFAAGLRAAEGKQ